MIRIFIPAQRNEVLSKDESTNKALQNLSLKKKGKGIDCIWYELTVKTSDERDSLKLIKIDVPITTRLGLKLGNSGKVDGYIVFGDNNCIIDICRNITADDILQIIEEKMFKVYNISYKEKQRLGICQVGNQFIKPSLNFIKRSSFTKVLDCGNNLAWVKSKAKNYPGYYLMIDNSEYYNFVLLYKNKMFYRLNGEDLTTKFDYLFIKGIKEACSNPAVDVADSVCQLMNFDKKVKCISPYNKIFDIVYDEEMKEWVLKSQINRLTNF